MVGGQIGIDVGGAEPTEAQHRHQHEQHHDQERLHEVGADDSPQASEKGVGGGHPDHHHHAHPVVEARQGLQQQTGPHALGDQEHQGVGDGDQQEHQPGQFSVAQAHEITAGA
jgi:hypothetical protein